MEMLIDFDRKMTLENAPFMFYFLYIGFYYVRLFYK